MFFKTYHHRLHLTGWPSDLASICMWYSYPNASIFYKSVASYLMHNNCMLYTSTGNNVLATTIKINSLGNLTCVSRSLNSHRFTRCSPFRSLNRFEHLPVQFFSRLLATIDEKNLVLRKIFFIFLNQVFCFIIEILCLLLFVWLILSLVRSTYLAVDHSLVDTFTP